jgi:hypothetical protein
MIDLTIILNIFKRNYLEEQISSILSQSALPKEIWIIQMSNHVDITPILKRYPHLKYIQSFVDIKYFGRFSLAKFISTRYCLVLDDDIIPSKHWINLSVENCEKFNAIICSNGRIIPPDDLYPEIPKYNGYLEKYFIGDALSSDFNYCPTNVTVDYPCSSYFFKKDWLKYFWALEPYTLDIGEDIHLAASCKILGNIITVVPTQDSLFNSGNIRPEYSSDEFASWKKSEFSNMRMKVLKHLIHEERWNPILWIEK